MKKKLKTHSVEETKKIAAKLAILLKPGDVITLEGELGVGKTMFTKGIAQGLGVKRMVTSPTYTIVKEYEGELPLYHMDAYRLEYSDEDIGFSEYFDGGGITVVEWGQFVADYLPLEQLNIEISYIDEHARLLIFNPKGHHYERVVSKLIGRY